MSTNLHRAAFGAIIASGFASAMGQILVLRELLVLFYGNELSTGIVLTAWLLWTAAGSLAGARSTQPWCTRPLLLAIGLWVQAALLPAAILFIRASRIIWSIPLGEMFPFGIMLAITLTATSVFCVTGGALFGLAWNQALTDLDARRGRPLNVYVGEAVGSAVGGLTAHYFVMPRLDGCDAAFGVAGILTLAGAFVVRLESDVARRSRTGLTILCVLVAAGWLAIPFWSNIGFASHRWHWGDGLIAVRNTPFHHLALLRDRDQFTLFGNGLWYFTIPDPQTAELAVHPAMLQHQEPRKVLLMGGSAGGLVQELLKYRTVERIDTVEPDPEVIRFVRDHAGVDAPDTLSAGRIRSLHGDGGAFIRHARGRYDVILLNVGEPVNADLNRFYTVEFYQRLRRLMEPDAILAFGLPSAPDVVGEAQVRYLSSIHTTLRSVFPDVLVIPGDSVRFLASPSVGTLSSDPGLLSARIRERRLELQFVQDSFLLDLMSPLRLDTMGSLLSVQPMRRINTDFNPTCYFNGLLVWTSQLHPLVGRSLAFWAEGLGKFPTVMVLSAAFTLLLLCLWGRRNEERPIRLAVAMAGGSLMVVEIVLLLGFQILEGFLYTELAVILSCFMTGLAAGSAAIGSVLDRIRSVGKWLIAVHFVLVLMVVCVMLAMFTLQRVSSWTEVPSWLSPAVFRCLALIAGGLGGIHFSLAAAAWARGRVLAARIGAGLYASDMTGAALGALVSSLLLLPLLGVHVTLLLFGGLLVFGGILLLSRLGWK